MGGEKIAHSATIKGKLEKTVSDALAAAHAVPSAPATGLLPAHKALLDAMFAQTRKTLHTVANTARSGVAAIAASDAQDQRDKKSIESTPKPEYGKGQPA